LSLKLASGEVGAHRFDRTEQDRKPKLGAAKVVVERAARDAGGVGVLFPDIGNREPLNLPDLGASDNGTNRAGRIDIHLSLDVHELRKAPPKFNGLLAIENLGHILRPDTHQKVLPWFAGRHCISRVRING
jgi:hypothetical protein